jgi:IS5 family transposase
MGQIGLFDLDNRLAQLSSMGDPLEKLSVIPWHKFEARIRHLLMKQKLSNAGRPPFNYGMMFKIMVLQHMYNLSDAQMQFQIIDRLSFRRFLGIGSEDTVPDEKTIWLFRETLTQAGAIRKLFTLFDRYLKEAGFSAKKGQIIDATFVELPRQRNSRDENDTINNGNIPSEWKNNPAKLRQKDIDARWTKKHGETHYGYKNHLNVDAKHKLIREYDVTPASVHDSHIFEEIFDVDNTGKAIWADSAYQSEDMRGKLFQRGIKNNINRKGYRNHPLSKFQQTMNRKRSSVRARIEHVNGRLSFMIGRWIYCIGRLRAAARIGMTNLVYNMTRYAYLVRYA